ncbi:MAG: 2,3-bisphosphoglycerate-independent phosphoglycerate mutase [Burkholderiales bacterium]|jgi:2,3-bisphosphoglycerate-independent phosphoglycerate mutase|nr:2,3-bisphosphoglycerate-independent phosphoglycerate mutase [Burkholderiales bacterium]
MALKKKILLIILDGFGLSDAQNFNAIKNANMPNWQYLTEHYAFGKIDASSQAVGLPAGQFGNSEVGHLNIGAGRVVLQDITRIDNSIADGSFFSNAVILKNLAATTTKTAHIMGLLSDGGVHSHIEHILALLTLAQQQQNIMQIYVHVFLDGRDTSPQSAAKYLHILEQFIAQNHKIRIATISGRFYAMDRDNRFDRILLAYNAIMLAKSDYQANNYKEVLTKEYSQNIFDEFIHPHVIAGYTGVKSGDSMIFANFRSDRALQLTDAIVNPEYSHFERSRVQLASFITMTTYDKRFNLDVAFAQNLVPNNLGEFLASLHYKQLRIAETEKYPHVTYFFNGGNKDPYKGETRILIPSPRNVATYDQQPEMSLPQVTAELITAITSNEYDFIITNFANGDMVGHTGDYGAAIKAVEALDLAIGKVITAMQENNGEVLIIADHGNCEEMYDFKAQQPHTQHTTNLVPFLYIGRKAKIKANGALKDVAPSLLGLNEIVPPPEMTGNNLIEFI